MSPEEILMHLAAGRYYGRESACGRKIDYKSEPTAVNMAEKLSERYGRDLEAYPCYWCSEPFPETNPPEFVHLNWHIGREMDQHERDLFSSEAASNLLEMEEVTINVAEASFGIQQGLVGLRVHNRKLCEGRGCSIHHPSDHHMKTWPLNWRADRGIMERMCEHYNDKGELTRTGHPDPDDADYRLMRDGENADPDIHGCDGCCSKRR